MMAQFQKKLSRLTAAISAIAITTSPALGQGLIRDTEIEAVMDEYTTPLLEAAELDPNSVNFYLVGNMEFNAFVTKGQNIFMNTGTIIRAENPNEIKGVIAHEIGHIQGAHLTRAGEEARGSMLTMAATMGIGLIAAMAGAGRAGAAIMASSQTFARLDFMSYSRAQEAAADQAAVRFLSATGQSGRGLVATFERLAYQERLSYARRWEYFRSHPLSSDRVSALQRNVESSQFADIVDTQDDLKQLQRLQAKITGFMAPPSQTFHRYPETDQSIPARYARAVAYYKQGLTDSAAKEVDGLLEIEPDNPYFHELKGQMFYENGRIDESISPYERAVELKPYAPLLRVGLASSLIASGKDDAFQTALRHLKFALTEEPTISYGWFQMAQAYAALGNEAMAEYATAEQYYQAGDHGQATMFAMRAQEDLERGSASWLRASEIIADMPPGTKIKQITQINSAQKIQNFQDLK